MRGKDSPPLRSALLPHSRRLVAMLARLPVSRRFLWGATALLYSNPSIPPLGILFDLEFDCDDERKEWWAGKDSNLRRHSQQIYSLPSLAT